MDTFFNYQEFRSARIACGLSQSEAAETLGITSPYLSMIEHGHKTPSPELVRRMAELYRVQPVTFVNSLIFTKKASTPS
jgi:transcriptional regulator with XRE-family HTH domain